MELVDYPCVVSCLSRPDKGGMRPPEPEAPPKSKGDKGLAPAQSKASPPTPPEGSLAHISDAPWRKDAPVAAPRRLAEDGKGTFFLSRRGPSAYTCVFVHIIQYPFPNGV